MKVEKEYLMMHVNELTRAQEHEDAFVAPDKIEHDALKESYSKHDRIKPVYFITKQVDGIPTNCVIDGYKYVMYAKENGIESIYCCRITVAEEVDLLHVMLQLQRSNHESYGALYKMIMTLWPIYFKGAGFRSDIAEKDLDKSIEKSAEGRPLNIYEKIGRQLNLTGTKVKHIRKVGMVNPLFFERIETSRFTLYAAYLECIQDERKAMPEVPPAKAPTFISTETDAPEFSEPTATDPEEFSEPTTSDEVKTDYKCVPTKSEDNAKDEEKVTDSVEPNDFIIVRGICQCCFEETEIKINKQQLR